MRHGRRKPPKHPNTRFSSRQGRVLFTRVLDPADGYGIKGQVFLSNLDWVANRDTIAYLKPHMIMNCCGGRCDKQSVVDLYQKNYQFVTDCVNFTPFCWRDVERLHDPACPLKIMWDRLTSEKNFVVMVHCVSCITNSPAAVALALLSYTDLKMPSILGKLQRHRSGVNPTDMIGWGVAAKSARAGWLREHWSAVRSNDDKYTARRWMLLRPERNASAASANPPERDSRGEHHSKGKRPHRNEEGQSTAKWTKKNVPGEIKVSEEQERQKRKVPEEQERQGEQEMQKSKEDDKAKEDRQHETTPSTEEEEKEWERRKLEEAIAHAEEQGKLLEEEEKRRKWEEDAERRRVSLQGRNDDEVSESTSESDSSDETGESSEHENDVDYGRETKRSRRTPRNISDSEESDDDEGKLSCDEQEASTLHEGLRDDRQCSRLHSSPEGGAAHHKERYQKEEQLQQDTLTEKTSQIKPLQHWRGNWYRKTDCVWSCKKLQRAKDHHAAGAPSRSRHAAQVRGPDCKQCKVKECARFCKYSRCRPCCLSFVRSTKGVAGCCRGSHHEETVQ